jgi:hypothetical protein
MVTKDHEAHPLVPLPRHVEWHDGICALPSDVAVVADQPDAAAVAAMFVMDLATQTGMRPHLAAEPRGVDVTLQLHAHRADLGTEGYELFAAADGLGFPHLERRRLRHLLFLACGPSLVRSRTGFGGG